MISEGTIKKLEEPQSKISYILGARLRNQNEVKWGMLSRGGRYKQVYPAGGSSKSPSPLKVKEEEVKDIARAAGSHRVLGAKISEGSEITGGQ